MDWFSILKNQVASTKGKQFQLDFNQPMIEEDVEDDDCKKTLMATYDRFIAKESIKGYTFMKDDTSAYPNFKAFLDNESAQTTGRGKEIFLRAFGKDILKNAPEEVCCKAIEIYKSLGDNSSEEFSEGGWVVKAGKNKNQSFSVFTFLSIYPVNSNMDSFFFEIVSYPKVEKNETTESTEENIKIVKELTKELIRL